VSTIALSHSSRRVVFSVFNQGLSHIVEPLSLSETSCGSCRTFWHIRDLAMKIEHYCIVLFWFGFAPCIYSRSVYIYISLSVCVSFTIRIKIPGVGGHQLSPSLLSPFSNNSALVQSYCHQKIKQGRERR